MKKYILAIDEGTTSARSILFNIQGNPISISQKEFTQIYPMQGYVEHDAKEILQKQMETIYECIESAHIDANEIAGIGITNQRETTVLWDKITGEPVYNAIVWQCRRTSDLARKLIDDGYSKEIENITGLKPDAYFSATKIQWILNNVPKAQELLKENRLLFGTIDSWLLWNLTNKKVHATDRTNASRTMLYDINKLCWSEELCKLLNIPMSILPEVYPSSHLFGTAKINGVEIPICGIAGDQQAALFGQGCFKEGEAKNTYGTGCFLLSNTGYTRIHSAHGLITTLAAVEDNQKQEYVLEGSVFIGGAVIQWLRDELGLIQSACESEQCALKVIDSNGVYIVPAFAGLGAPYWDMYARGTITGLTRGANKNHIVRAALESIAYQTEDLLKSIKADLSNIPTLYVDGGASRNAFLMQFQADISHCNVQNASTPETTARGAAFLAGLSCGIYRDRDEIKSMLQYGNTYTPKMSQEKRDELLSGWHQAVKACMVK